MSESLILGTTSTGIRKKILVDSDGKLITSGGGGGGGGDASASNQQEQITLAETLNDDIAIIKSESQAQTIVQEAMNQKLEELDLIEQHLNTKLIKCDTDNVIIDSSDPVQVVGLAKVYNTLNNAFLTTDADQSLRVNVVNQISNITGYALESTLTNIKTELTDNMPTKAIQIDTAEEVSLIRQQHTPLQHEQRYADILVDGPTMSADSNPPFTYHPTIEGFYYSNTVSGGASNLYFYANTQAKQTQYTISQLMNSYAVITLGNMTATNTLPFLIVYSKPQGAGDHAVWYRSRWVYTIPNTAQLSAIGQQFMIYWGEEPSMKIHPNVHRVEATLTSSAGPALSSEILQYLTVNTDSSATINTVKAIYQNVGFTTYGGLIHDTKLGYGKQDKTREITTKIDNLNSTVGAGVFVQLDGNVSGLKLKSTLNDGSADVNVKNSFNLESTQQQLKSQLDKLTFNTSNELLVASSGGSSGYPDVNIKCNDVLLTQTPSGTKNCLDVEVNNMVDVSALATESTLSTLSTLVSNQSAYSRFQTEAPVSDGKLDTIISNMSLTNFNVNNLTKCDTDNIAIPNGVNINNFPTSTQISGPVSIDNFPTSTQISGPVSIDNFPTSTQISGPVSIDNYPASQTINGTVSIDGTVPISSGSPLDVHCFGSSDGITFHHLKTNPQGVLSTNAIMETDANGALTSTVSETENYNALDVKVKGTTSVSGSVQAMGLDSDTSTNVPLKVNEDGVLSTSILGAVSVQNATGQQLEIKAKQYGSYGNVANNLASLLPSSATSGIDVSDWSYFIGYYQDYNGATTGNIRLQYSFDNITYYNLFGTTIFPSGTSPRTTTIYKQDIPGINYIRLYNETSSTLISITLTLLGGSLS